MIFLRDHLPDIVQILQNGGVACLPTDTIWGLHADATDPEAVRKVSAIKGKKPEKGYIALVSSLEMLKKYVPHIHPRLETLLAYHQRPLTVVYEGPEGLAPETLAPMGTAAIRIVKDEFCRQIIEMFGKPIVSTAACLEGRPFPPHFGAITSDILQASDYVAKHRQRETDPGQPSSIARLDEFHELEFVRE